MCAGQNQINLLLTAYSLSFALGGISFYHIPDQVGRLKSLHMFNTPNLISQLVILFIPSYWAKMFGFFLFGLTSTKSSLSYVYLNEFMNSRDKAFASSCINFVDVTGTAVAGLFWLYVERDCHSLFVGTVAITIIGYCFLVIVNAESPRWLLLNGRTVEAIRVLNYIAWFNGVENRVKEETKFIEA